MQGDTAWLKPDAAYLDSEYIYDADMADVAAGIRPAKIPAAA
jgi:hypothetical protein